jgi:hypothetical protein
LTTGVARLFDWPVKSKRLKNGFRGIVIPKQRGTILKTDKNMHRGGMKWIYGGFSTISGGRKMELTRGNRGLKTRFSGFLGQKMDCFCGFEEQGKDVMRLPGA